MVDEVETEKPKPLPPVIKYFGVRPAVLNGPGPAEVFWLVPRADDIFISLWPDEDLDYSGHRSVIFAKTVQVTLTAKHQGVGNAQTVTVTVNPVDPLLLKEESEPELPKDASGGARFSRYTHASGTVGYVFEDGREERDDDGQPHLTDPNKCPSCETEAPSFDPPRHDERYKRRIQEVKIAHDLDDEDDIVAARAFLKATGCYVTRCPNCDTSFRVIASAAKIVGE